MKTSTLTDYPIRGIGKPDYSRNVHAARQRAGLELKYSQVLKSFYIIYTTKSSPYSWIKSPLAVGATGHLVDAETGEDMPYTLPKGYTISAVQDSLGFSEDHQVWGYVDTYPLILFSISGGGLELYRNRVIPFNTALLDPTAAAAHEIDIQVENKGGEAMEGAFALSAILEEVGTDPLPTIKTVKCKHCGHTWEVQLDTTNLICPKCNQLTLVFNASQFRGV